MSKIILEKPNVERIKNNTPQRKYVTRNSMILSALVMEHFSITNIIMKHAKNITYELHTKRA